MPLEKNPISSAFIDEKSFKGIYFCGGLFGGSCEEFIEMSEKIDHLITLDSQNNFVAIWHDESYLNKYINMITEYKTLNRSFCHPQEWETKDIVPKIILRKKSNFFNVKKFKGQNYLLSL